MRLSLDGMKRPQRDEVYALITGYEGDARAGVPIQEQAERLWRWRHQGWSVRVYHCNILAMVIGYQRAKIVPCTT